MVMSLRDDKPFKALRFLRVISNLFLNLEDHDCKMVIRVLSLEFLFIVRLKFPLDKLIANIIRSRYNDKAVKLIRRFEKLDFKIRKNEADLDFLQSPNTKFQSR